MTLSTGKAPLASIDVQLNDRRLSLRVCSLVHQGVRRCQNGVKLWKSVESVESVQPRLHCLSLLSLTVKPLKHKARVASMHAPSRILHRFAMAVTPAVRSLSHALSMSSAPATVRQLLPELRVQRETPRSA